MISRVLLLVSVALLLGRAEAVEAADDVPPFAAHNAYRNHSHGTQRLIEALDAGLDHVEVDVNYDAVCRRVVVTHDRIALPFLGPPLERYLQPLWDRWEASGRSGFTLILDMKSRSGTLAKEIHEILAGHANSLSQMASSAGSPFRPGRITVCLSGTEEAKRAFRRICERRGSYIAFPDVVYDDDDWSPDVSTYVPPQRAGWVRFLTFDAKNFMASPRHQGPEGFSVARLQATLGLARAAGYTVRVYTLNARGEGGSIDTRLWDACARAGVPMIATDDYQLAAEWWRGFPAARAGSSL